MRFIWNKIVSILGFIKINYKSFMRFIWNKIISILGFIKIISLILPLITVPFFYEDFSGRILQAIILFTYICFLFFFEIQFWLFIYSSLILGFVHIVYSIISSLGFKVDFSNLTLNFISFFLLSSYADEFNYKDFYIISVLLIALNLITLYYQKNKKVSTDIIKTIWIKLSIYKIISYKKFRLSFLSITKLLLVVSLSFILIFFFLTPLLINILIVPKYLYPKNSQFNNLILAFTGFYLNKFLYGKSKVIKINNETLFIIDDYYIKLQDIRRVFTAEKYRIIYCKSIDTSKNFKDFFSNLAFNSYTNFISRNAIFYNYSDNQSFNLSVIPFSRLTQYTHSVEELKYDKIQIPSNKDFSKFKNTESKICKQILRKRK